MSSNSILKDFGIHLKNIRVQKNITQEQLAHLCELDRTYISGIERGKRNISLINLYKIASSLDIHPSELLAFNVTDAGC
ncbi:helix-turn-helix domain-containing protein [Acinetobacter tibetensis]|jgi:transcriptional regulator with XRE-family HTH domain|uniref:helix-turn-helix domain-containing protein n=1 Tax=Acinetobacter tibetensis TaxID=2943497 RepID=UPI003A4DDD1D